MSAQPEVSVSKSEALQAQDRLVAYFDLLGTEDEESDYDPADDVKLVSEFLEAL
jgi:hypothetical protein